MAAELVAQFLFPALIAAISLSIMATFLDIFNTAIF
jgi:hypothetical protein